MICHIHIETGQHMRNISNNNGLTVRAVAGSHCVILGIDLSAEKRKGCLGFAIQRSKLSPLDADEKSASFWMRNTHTFKEVPASDTNPAWQSTQNSPWQNFRYIDFSARPGAQYVYLVVAKYGAWNALQDGASTSVTITTENPANPETALFFNRAAATSEAYYRKFGDLSPNQMPPDQQKAAYAWLSNGLEQAILDFLAQAKDGTYALHAAVYEFQWDSLLQGLKAAKEGGAKEVTVVYHHRTPPQPARNSKKANATDSPETGSDSEDDTGTAAANDAAIARNGLSAAGVTCIQRKANPQGAIMHNKFVVLLQNGKPQAVWTGSTNWTDGGLYGQLNLGYAVHDPPVALAYETYWQALAKDTSAADSRKNAAAVGPVSSADAGKIAPGYTAVFSPQDSKTQMLNLYASICAQARFLLVCAPFELAHEIVSALEKPAAGQASYLLLDKEGSIGIGTDKGVNSAAFKAVKANLGTLISVATPLNGPLYSYQQSLLEHKESFHHVGVHIHSKIIAADPLGPDPILVLGSANYSNGSTHTNDENSLIIRGKTAIADICISEFMRMFDTYRFRYAHKDDLTHPGNPKLMLGLASDDSWTNEFYVPGSALALGRAYFAGTV
jgi:phosphatidylserine/phosphatidylglycerophosphate/cardiolipin synthase-like enzyme